MSWTPRPIVTVSDLERVVAELVEGYLEDVRAHCAAIPELQRYDWSAAIDRDVRPRLEAQTRAELQKGLLNLATEQAH